MNKKITIYLLVLAILVIGSITIMYTYKGKVKEEKTSKIDATVLMKENNRLTVQDDENIIYTFDHLEEVDAEIGSSIAIQYTGLLDKSVEYQTGKILNCKTKQVIKDENGIPTDWLDSGIFSNYYILAYKQLEKMSLDEKIAQILLVRYPDNNAKSILEKNQFAGYVFFEKDFKNKTEKAVQDEIKALQSVAKVPILTAVDEEGGKVVRISSNKDLVDEKFKSSRELYTTGGFDLIKKDTIEKSAILKKLGINLNLAPVVDVSTNSNDYIYERTLGENTDLTAEYAKTVIEASKKTGVSYTLKHFPGYGNNSDTHQGSSTDNRTYDEIEKNDLPPFKAGIEQDAEAVLVSHNTVTNIDSNNPASLSPSVHNLLRNNMKFTGIIMTDDLGMGATSSISNKTVKAILAGNDLIITTDYEESINEIQKAIDDKTISENLIDKLAFRVLAWKYYKGLMFNMHKQ